MGNSRVQACINQQPESTHNEAKKRPAGSDRIFCTKSFVSQGKSRKSYKERNGKESAPTNTEEVQRPQLKGSNNDTQRSWTVTLPGEDAQGYF